MHLSALFAPALLLGSLVGSALGQTVTLPLHPDPVFRPTPTRLTGRVLGASPTATTYLLAPSGAWPRGSEFWISLTVTVIRTSTIRYSQNLVTMTSNVITPGWTEFHYVTWTADATCTASACAGFHARKETVIVHTGGTTLTVPAFPASQLFPARVQPTNVAVVLGPNKRDAPGDQGANAVAPRMTAAPWVA